MSKFRIFDFDDTLVKTDAKVVITGKRGRRELSSTEFATYKLDPSDKTDVSQFGGELINPRMIEKYVRLLLTTVYSGAATVIILTARHDSQPVAEFLRAIGIRGGVKIKTMGNPDPNLKRDYIEELITRRGATDIEFYDDSPKNIAAVSTLQLKYPQIRIKTVQVPHL
jgi:hypothetical protein